MRYTGLLSYWLILPLFALNFTVQADDDATPSTTNEVQTVIEALSQPKAAPKLTGSQLIKELKSGGYVIFMRHALSEEENDEYEVDLENCKTQRNLSEKGKKQAKTIGSAVKKLGIPIGEVHTSPYCRCVDTAQLVFGQANSRPELTYAAALETEEERAEYSDTLLQLLSIAPEEGKNTVIVSHSVNLQEATGILPKPEGVVHIFKPTDEGYEHIGEIKPDFWDIFLFTAP
ncbi:histidine phosphatase family protein [Candidatus Albibeggiatoa sp. nov. BB20]|uniref:histidine phosphatase family protein n=1 Tax=Candidatus Albibeggiatoa sp. nov. BB20 TaxID=3162723 RepID=UPI00336532EA